MWLYFKSLIDCDLLAEWDCDFLISIIQMTIISTTVGNNPLEEME